MNFVTPFSSDEERGKSLVLQSTVETRVRLLKDDYARMDVEHRKQEQKNEKLVKDKEEEVNSMILSLPRESLSIPDGTMGSK